MNFKKEELKELKKDIKKEKKYVEKCLEHVDAFEDLEKKLNVLKDEVIKEPNEHVKEFDENDVATLILYVKIQIRMHATLEEAAALIGEYGPWMFFAIELLKIAVIS
jgi:CRISPR/Cas system CSM-associated protein Csm4 (group 5 of RAMP superfamily)